MIPSFNRIVVPIDFGPASLEALQYAKSLAGGLDASVHMLHVLEDPLTRAWSEVYVPDFSTVREHMTKEAERRLANLRTTLEPVSATFEVAFGSPTETIVRTAAERGADLIVMGTHGRHGVAHLLIGSVAERVIRMAPCPVLAVRAGALGASLERVTAATAVPEPSAA